MMILRGSKNSTIEIGKESDETGRIASAMGIPVNTLTNRFAGLLKEYRAYRRIGIIMTKVYDFVRRYYV